MSEENISRRNILSLITAGIGGLITLAIAIPGIAYVIGPALQREDQESWLLLGNVDKIETGEPTLFKVTIERTSGWISDQEEISVYVYTDNGRDYVAMSNICTHLGCRVRWISEQEQFFCPCHNAVFAKTGEVVSGPPPRPLDQFTVRVEDNQIFIQGG